MKRRRMEGGGKEEGGGRREDRGRLGREEGRRIEVYG